MRYATVSMTGLARRLALVLALGALAACSMQPTAGPRDRGCSYPGASPECRGLHS